MKRSLTISSILLSLFLVWQGFRGMAAEVQQPPAFPSVEPTAASSLVADYQFRDTLDSSVGNAPALANLGSNSFDNATIDDSARRALSFEPNNGLALAPTTGLFPGQSYSIVMLFSLVNTFGNYRLLDFKNGTSNNGLYCSFDGLDFRGAAGNSNRVLKPNNFVQLVITRSTEGDVTIYVNGVRQLFFVDTSGNATVDSNNTLRFFRDNNGEASAGVVARIRIYNATLSGGEVANLDRLPNPQASCPSPSGLTQNNGAPGTSFLLNGFGLSGVTAVRFPNNLNAPFTINDDTQISVTVPNGAVSGTLTLVKPNCGEVQTHVVFNVPSSSPPSLVADYQFQNGLNSTSGYPPALLNLGSNSFANVGIDNQTRRALKFDLNNGVAVFSTTGVISNQSYTVVALFSLSETFGNYRLLDFKNGTSNNGLYCSFEGLDFRGGAGNSNRVLKPNNFAQLVMTRNTAGNVAVYVNGVIQFSFVDTNGNAVLEGSTLRFFRDNMGDGEASDGYVARIRLYNTALSSSEVAALDRLPPQQTACPAVTAINPASGSVGSTVAITGANLTDVTEVKFAGGIAAQFIVNSNTSITATVPAGAASGVITISKPDCPDVQTTSFTVTPPSARALRVTCASGTAGGVVSLPIELLSQGDENALGFSLNFDQTILSNPQVALGSGATAASLNTNLSQAGQGRIGLALALPSGQSFAAGTRQLAVVSFNIAASTTVAVTGITFGDTPIARQVSNAIAQPVSASYQGCAAIVINTGYEADVTPRPNGKGNATVAITDWVQVGRFTAGLDTAAAGGEFQRADCAPREVKGDGRLTVTDWVQAGRFVAGLDAVQTAGGPSNPVTSFAASRSKQAIGPTSPRTIRAVTNLNARSRRSELTIELDARGDESALGFSLNFDPKVLRYESAALASGAGGAQLLVNSSQAAGGRVGIALALPPGQSFEAGRRKVITLSFKVVKAGDRASTSVVFADQPIHREISDTGAMRLPASYAESVPSLPGSAGKGSVKARR